MPPKAQSTTKPPSAAPAASSRGRRRRGPRSQTVVTRPAPLELVVSPSKADLVHAQFPDENTRGTVMWRSTLTTNVSSNADGDLLLTVLPLPNAAMVKYPLTSSVSTGSGTISTVTDYASLASSFGYCRVVTMSAELDYIGAADAAKGVICVATGTVTPVGVGHKMADLADETTYREGQITQGEGVAAIVVQQCSNFSAIANTSADAADPMTFIYLGVLGGVADTTGSSYRLRVVIVGEYIPAITSLLSTQVVTSPHHAGLMSVIRSMSAPGCTVAAGKDALAKVESARSAWADYLMKKFAVGVSKVDWTEVITFMGTLGAIRATRPRIAYGGEL